jgi:hypothetical protein
MSYKQMPRLGSAIASTILSVFSAVSLVGVDKAQAALLTYNFLGDSRNFLKVDTSSVREVATGISAGSVSEGRYYGFTREGQEYNNLAGVTAIFREGNFYGVQAGGDFHYIRDYIIPPDEPYGPRFERVTTDGYWQIVGPTFESYSETWRRLVNYQSYIEDGSIVIESAVRDGRSRNQYDFTYTLVNTEPSPVVPEPLTAGGTALALAGLSWLKHKKKKAA